MLASNSRKLMLSGWLKLNGNTEYNSPLKLQNFLFLYEAFAKVNGDVSDFSQLFGYPCGPVFDSVYNDSIHNKNEFSAATQQEFLLHCEQMNDEHAKKSLFLLRILSEKELTSLLCKLNLWKSKESEILQGSEKTELQERDFNEEDAKKIQLLDLMYPASLIYESKIIEVNKHYFVFTQEDAARLSRQHFGILNDLAKHEQLENPVYGQLSEEGILIID